jgi:hypothetical protein
VIRDGDFSVWARGGGCEKSAECGMRVPGGIVGRVIVRAEGARLDVLTDL